MNIQEQAIGAPPKLARTATPHEFYRRLVARPEIRDLLRRRAKR